MTLFAALVETSGRVGATRSRLVKLRELAQFLRGLQADEIETGVLFLSGELRQGKTGIGHALLQQARAVSAAHTPQLTLIDVDRALAQLVAIRGGGSLAQRRGMLTELFAHATQDEQDFLARLLIGELRQGALAGLMIEAIALAAGLPTNDVRRAAMYAPQLGVLARSALIDAAAGLAQYRITVLKPIAPMLAQTAPDVASALEQLGGAAAFEWKVDGARVQAHKSGDEVRIFTRNLHDVSAAVPEVLAAVRALPRHTVVLDGETVALDDEGRPRPFQITMRRFGRRLDVESLRRELPLHVYFFDCLRLDDDDLADRPAAQRFAALDSLVPQPMRMPRIVASNERQAQQFYDDALAHGHEGVMAKALDSAYEAGSRGASWLKIKRVHTLDLVILAAEWGHGRRSGKLSNLHLGARDPHTGEYVMLGKTFKGLTDAMLEWQTRELLEYETHRDRYTVYVKPAIVVEIAFNDIQASPQYPGGLSLRFARVKAHRPDKSVQQANTLDDIRAIYAAQR